MRSGNDAAGPWSLQSLSVAPHDDEPARVTIRLAHVDAQGEALSPSNTQSLASSSSPDVETAE